MGVDVSDLQVRRPPVMLYVPHGQEDVRAVLGYIANHVRDFDASPDASVLATVKDGAILGAVAYHNYRVTDIEMVAAGKPGWLTRTTLRAYFAYPFLQLGCRRVTAVCHRKNKHARKFVEKLGWRLEGVHREAMADGHDAISYGMLAKDCRWIN